MCYKNYILEDEDQLDIVSTKKTVYGYLSSLTVVLNLEKVWNSYSTNTKASIGLK